MKKKKQPGLKNKPTPKVRVIQQSVNSSSETKAVEENDFTDKYISKSQITNQSSVSKEIKQSWKTQDTISSLGVITSILLFVITLLTFYQTKRAVDISEVANKELIKQYEVGKEQFEKANLPYLQCSNFAITNFGPNKVLKISYQIENLGNYPAQITLEKAKLSFLPNIPEEEPFNNLSVSPTEYGYFVSKEKPVKKIYFKNKVLEKATYDSILNNSLRVFFFGEVEYKNPISKKQRKYKFYTELFSPPSNEFRVIYNDNSDIE